MITLEDIHKELCEIIDVMRGKLNVASDDRMTETAIRVGGLMRAVAFTRKVQGEWTPRPIPESQTYLESLGIRDEAARLPEEPTQEPAAEAPRPLLFP